MPKEKIALNNLHKVVVHPNRWLIWTIVYVLFVAIAMFGYIQVSKITFETQAQSDIH